ncbi:MAG: MBL fold metallo-hydrolase [Oscillospiraceae bacterium]|nr:MBL fold metallo-hydrolase [Oscillospiraceae bacterium]
MSTRRHPPRGRPQNRRPANRRSPQRGRRRNTRRRRPLLTLFILLLIGGAAYFGFAAFAHVQLPIPLEDGQAAVHFIDVGQGDATLIQTSRGSVLIDGGDHRLGMGERVVEYLRDAGISELTYVIATHPHADHIGGLVEVLQTFPVGTLIMPPVTHTTLTFERFIDAIEENDIYVRAPVAGSSFSVGEAVFTIIAPNAAGYGNLNDYSVSLRMALGETSFIFTGDAEELSELEMIAAGHVLSSDVLRVGHHGSRTSTAQAFLDAVDPTIAVISLGRDNSYGHPHSVVMERLQGIRVYRTDEHGHIVMITDGTEITVRGVVLWRAWFNQLMQWIG